MITNHLASIADDISISYVERWIQAVIDWTIAFLPKLVSGLLVFVIGWWLSSVAAKFILKAMKRTHADETVMMFLNSIIKNVFRVIIIISAMGQLGINVTSIITALGAATVAVGLALQSTMSNVASGTLIILNKPFKVGDFLSFGGLQGTVTKIEMMNTYLKSADNKEIIIPNSKLTADSIVNYSSLGMRRLDLKFSIGYNDDIEKAKSVLLKVIARNSLALKDPEPTIGVSSHAESSVVIDVLVWCKCENYFPLFYSMQEEVKKEFDKNGITIPYNQLCVHIEK
ncbi:MAG: mechanosensitive ion channel family protein [Acutalibacteraceae bacterium]